MPSNMCALRSDTREKKSLKGWLKFNWAFLVAQLVENLHAMQETPVQSMFRRSGDGNGYPLQYSGEFHGQSLITEEMPFCEQVHVIKLHKK